MKIIKKIITIILCFVVLCSVINCKKGIRDNRDRDITNQIRINELQAALINRDFKNARLYLDTLKEEYPNKPLYCYIEGWIYDMQDNRNKAEECFNRAIQLSNILIDTITSNEVRDYAMVERALSIQALYGQETYLKSLDSIVAYDTSVIESVRNRTYRKDCMFYGKAYKDENGYWHCYYLPPNDTASIEELKRRELECKKNKGKRKKRQTWDE